MMATAAKVTIAEVEELVEPGRDRRRRRRDAGHLRPVHPAGPCLREADREADRPQRVGSARRSTRVPRATTAGMARGQIMRKGSQVVRRRRDRPPAVGVRPARRIGQGAGRVPTRNQARRPVLRSGLSVPLRQRGRRGRGADALVRRGHAPRDDDCVRRARSPNHLQNRSRRRSGVTRGEAARRSGRGAVRVQPAKLRYLQSAIGLHAVAAGAAWRFGRDADVLEQTGLVRTFYLDTIWRDDPAFADLWCRAGGALLTGSIHYGEAIRHYDRCLVARPHNAWFLLGRGSTLEAVARLAAGLGRGERLSDWPESQDARELRKKAAADYRNAIEQAPDLGEARIRLAHVEVSDGQFAEASRDLAQVLGARLTPVLAYWSHLFLGAADEGAGRPADAVGRVPGGAVGVLRRRSRRRLPWRTCWPKGWGSVRARGPCCNRTSAPAVGRSFESDPWWLYAGAQGWRAPGWLDGARTAEPGAMRPLVAGLIAVLATGAVSAGQAPPTFRAGVDAVTVDVLATHRGQPVSGLTAGDFEVLDDGVRQQHQFRERRRRADQSGHSTWIRARAWPVTVSRRSWRPVAPRSRP